jgi:uncharacterized protein with HEPN domain
MAPLAFLEKLFSIFLKAIDPEAGKKKQLKQLTKELIGNRHAKFYLPKQQEVDPSLGKFFYDIYQILSHVQVFLENAARSVQLKQLTVETFLDIKYLDARQRLNADYVAEQAKSMPISEISKILQEDLDLLSTAFDDSLIATVDHCYNQIVALIQLSNFDYFFFLKKFDPFFIERNFNYLPKFNAVRGQYITDQLKDFLDISQAVDPDEDWETALTVLKLYKNGMDVVVPEQWNRVLSQIRELKHSGILEFIIKHIDRDPNWEFEPKESGVSIAQEYLEGRRIEVQEAMNSCVSAQKRAQINYLASSIFGDPDIKRTRYYTDQESEIYIKKEFKGFIYTAAINYLKVFLTDIFKKEMQDLCEFLLIRGQWSSVDISQEMSSCYHQLLDISDQLIVFDESLSEDGTQGSRLRAAIVKFDRDKSQTRSITHALYFVNDHALSLINAAARAFIVIGKNLKNIHEDYHKDFPEFILNWRELEPLSEVPLLQQINYTYRRIYNFIQLLQLLSKQSEKQLLA